MSEPIKKCENCQQSCQDDYFSVELKKEKINSLLCPTCWEPKKKEYEKIIKEKYLPTENLADYGIENVMTEVFSGYHWQKGLQTFDSVCWGCGGISFEEGQHNSLSCKKIGKERKRYWELKGWEDHPAFTEENKKELKELEKKYRKSNNDNPREREREREREQIQQYFKQHNIKFIKLKNNKLVIEYNNSQTESKEANTQELQAIKSYAERLGKNELTLKDLEQSNPSQTPKSNKLLYWGLGIVGVLVVGVVVWLVVKNNKNK